MRKRDYKVIV